MMSRIGLHKAADLIFGITQKPLFLLHHQTWSGNISPIKELF